MSEKLTVGVLGLQGDLEEHIKAVENAHTNSAEAVLVKDTDSMKKIDALIIPGGESTVMGGLSSIKGIVPALRDRITGGLPVLGTCAGMIMLAKKAYDRVVNETNQPLIGTLDVTVERNAFGRQRESFEARLNLTIPGGEDFSGVFIRAPVIKSTGEGVTELARFEGNIVAVQQRNAIATSFHPELSGSTLVHEYLIGLAASYREARSHQKSVG
ncbi:MAG: pyridoxal 5'-phosphate synthase glutaminase subunit PdxT [Nitrososphaerota archaeon]|nr:pyridoxal 5'-phosphate synthase glutaminase subunit PdxT [Nitrososphaerota archaeon]MDG7024163.1 pyridoxal 5'-phosphate synthase glutaminase subunit PdxT [Nitrososphaerota archaeon]